MIVQNRFFIDGQWQQPAGASVCRVINPATEEPMGQVPNAEKSDVDAAVRAARKAFDSGDWPRVTAEARIAVLEKAMTLLAARQTEIAELITAEMGALLSLGGHLPWAFEWWRDVRDSYRSLPLETIRRHAEGVTLVVREPIGVVAGITPWNAPLALAIEKMTSALVTGCTMVLKPPLETPLDADFLARALQEAGLPDGVFNVVPGGRDIGAHLVGHPDIDMVCLTGSTVAGRAVGEVCGRNLKRVQLELGGKSAAIILPDADLDVFRRVSSFGCFGATGQACILLSRVLAPRSRYNEVLDALRTTANEIHVGDPRDLKTHMGPLVSERQRTRVESYITQGRAQGARLVCGGQRPEKLPRGWYVEPTIFADVDSRMTIAQEEIFGPVISVIPYDDEEAAVRIANDSDFGLHGAVFTRDVFHGIKTANRIRSGTVGVNRYGNPPNAPFGGYKASGLGREHGPEGVDEHHQLKSISLADDWRPKVTLGSQ